MKQYNNTSIKDNQSYWRMSFEKARASQNWGELLEIGKRRLSEEDFELAIECFIESRHYNSQEPLTHKFLGEAYQFKGNFLKEQKDEETALICYKKAKESYQNAIANAENDNNTHFLSEYKQEIENYIKELKI